MSQTDDNLSSINAAYQSKQLAIPLLLFLQLLSALLQQDFCVESPMYERIILPQTLLLDGIP